MAKTAESKAKMPTCEHVRCPLQELLTRLGDKWSMLVIITLARSENNRLRFSELMRGVNGISQRMLTTTLRHLERDGILSRRQFPEVPPRVEYTLTERGKGLLTPVKALVTWIEAEWPEIEKSRQAYDLSDEGRQALLAQRAPFARTQGLDRDRPRAMGQAHVAAIVEGKPSR
jgi:DNA-binding HxlR family transcriptional regulator